MRTHPPGAKVVRLMRMKISFLKNDTKRKASRHFQHFEDLKFHTFYGEACLRTLKPLSSELAQPIIPILIIRSRFFTYTLPPTPHPPTKNPGYGPGVYVNSKVEVSPLKCRQKEGEQVNNVGIYLKNCDVFKTEI